MNLAICDGTVTLETGNLISCDGTWTTAVYYPPSSVLDIDPATATQMLMAGFTIYIVPWGAMFGLALVLKTIRNRWT